MKAAIAVATAAVSATAALADEPGTFTYEAFETAVQHVDLPSCPGDLAAEGRFCRMTINNDSFHVFAFEEGGEQRMVGLQSWYEDEIDLTFR